MRRDLDETPLIVTKERLEAIVFIVRDPTETPTAATFVAALSEEAWLEWTGQHDG